MKKNPVCNIKSYQSYPTGTEGFTKTIKNTSELTLYIADSDHITVHTMSENERLFVLTKSEVKHFNLLEKLLCLFYSSYSSSLVC